MYKINKMYSNRKFSIKIDRTKLNCLLKNASLLNSDDHQALTNMEKKLRKDNTLTYAYKQKNDSGRLYSTKTAGSSLQFLEKTVRNTILNDYVDVDIRNCFINILIGYCKEEGIPCEKMEDYERNRERYIKEYQTEEFNIKETVNKMINDVNFSAYKYLKKKPDWLTLLKGEFETIQDYIAEAFKDDLDKLPKKKGGNKIGQLVSRFLQNRENDFLCETLSYMENKLKIPIDNVLFMFDGYMLPRELITQDDIDNINQHFNCGMKYFFKPMETINFTEEQLDECSEENNADYLLWKETFDEKCFFCHETLVYYVDIGYGVFKECKKGVIFDVFAGQREYINEWFDDPTKRSYLKIGTYPPPLTCPEGHYNLWQGFYIEKVESQVNDNTQRTLEMFNELTFLLSGEDETNHKYLLSWLADIIQNPGKKNGIALALFGSEGTGKGSLEQILAKMMSDLYIPVSDVTSLFAGFNELLSGKIIACVDEVEKLSTVSVSEKLKTFITNPLITINGKGNKAFCDNNHIRLMMMTNNEKFLKVSMKDRRYVAFTASNARINDTDFFGEYYNLIEDETNVKAVFDYLKNYDINKIRWIQDRPETEIMISNKLDCLPYEIKFLKYLLLEEKWEGDEYILSSASVSHINKIMSDGTVKDRAIHKKLATHKDCFTYNRTKIQNYKVFNRQTLYDYLDGFGYISAEEQSEFKLELECQFIEENDELVE